MKLVALAAAWIAGLLVGLETNVYLPALVLFSLSALILAWLFRSKGVSPWPALLAVFVAAGVLRVEASEAQGFLVPSDTLQPVKVRGLVVNDPEFSGPGVEFILSVDAVEMGQGWEESQGKLLVLARPPGSLVLAREEPYFRYGDRLELEGRLKEPPVLGDFDYRAYLANQGIYSTMPFPQEVRLIAEGEGNPARGGVYALRRELSEGIATALPEPQASLAEALLLGRRGNLEVDPISWTE